METWISTHPYLQSIADFHAQLSEAAKKAQRTFAQVPNWHDYTDDFNHGVPVLRSPHFRIDYPEIEFVIASLLEKLACMPLQEKLKKESLELCAQLHGDSGLFRLGVAWLLFGNLECPLSHPGLFRHVAWTAVARYLHPVLAAFESWRDEESWLQPYCPICGSGPSMSQLVGADPGRSRVLVCGCCGVRWRFRRVGCPFCENASNHKLSVLAVEGEKRLRIDYCSSCFGFLKTYDGEGAEAVMLADWTSIHLDLLAMDRGLRRLANSLYSL